MFAQIDEIALFVHNCEYIVSSLVSKNKSNNVYSWEKTTLNQLIQMCCWWALNV